MREGNHPVPMICLLAMAHFTLGFPNLALSTGTIEDMDAAQESVCMTTSGPRDNHTCIFPFRWNGEVYNQCTNVNNGHYNNTPWCATQVDPNEKIVGTNWGNCGSACFECMTISGPRKQHPCVFPFLWNEIEYNKCTNESNVHYKDAPWCATQVDSTGNVVGTNWGNCGTACPGTPVAGQLCGKTICKPGTECCYGCDGPLDMCEIPFENGGPGCPLPGCPPKNNTSGCLESCTYDYNPVCGTDGKTYTNMCILENAACEEEHHNLAISYQGECKATCTDGIQNGDETGPDCGGAMCPDCATCTDGIQNGDEKGTDCGGRICPACELWDKYCAIADCSKPNAGKLCPDHCKVCKFIEIHTLKYGNENNYAISSCMNKGKYDANKIYMEECCLTAGTYNLDCKCSYGDGWHGGYIKIDGKEYCKDFTEGYNKTVQVNFG